MHLLPLEFNAKSNEKKKKTTKKTQKKGSSPRNDPPVYRNDLTINYCTILNTQCNTEKRMAFEFLADEFSEDNKNLYTKTADAVINKIMNILNSSKVVSAYIFKRNTDQAFSNGFHSNKPLGQNSFIKIVEISF